METESEPFPAVSPAPSYLNPARPPPKPPQKPYPSAVGLLGIELAVVAIFRRTFSRVRYAPSSSSATEASPRFPFSLRTR